MLTTLHISEMRGWMKSSRAEGLRLGCAGDQHVRGGREITTSQQSPLHPGNLHMFTSQSPFCSSVKKEMG